MRKVDPVLGGRIEPVILVRTGVILVSLGRTELRALILHDRLYFMVPDGAPLGAPWDGPDALRAAAKSEREEQEAMGSN